MNDVINSQEFKYTTLVKRIKSVPYISMSKSYHHQVQHKNELKTKNRIHGEFHQYPRTRKLALNHHGHGRKLSGKSVLESLHLHLLNLQAF